MTEARAGGSLANGRYLLVEPVADRGGLTAVWRARDAERGRP